MTPRLDSADTSGAAATHAGSGADARRRTQWAVTVALVSAVLVCCQLSCVLSATGAATTLTGIPEPLFGHAVTYVPEQGPPNPALLDSRPEAIVRAYLADYLRLAGTFPCVPDLGRSYDDLQDPVLHGESCPITRPVAIATITSVTIRPHGLLGVSDAIVRVVITYTNGSLWIGDIGMTPDRYQFFWPIYTHLDCWSGSETFAMFGRLVPDIPRGVGYGPPGGPYHCQR